MTIICFLRLENYDTCIVECTSGVRTASNKQPTPLKFSPEEVNSSASRSFMGVNVMFHAPVPYNRLAIVIVFIGLCKLVNNCRPKQRPCFNALLAEFEVPRRDLLTLRELFQPAWRTYCIYTVTQNEPGRLNILVVILFNKSINIIFFTEFFLPPLSLQQTYKNHTQLYLPSITRLTKLNALPIRTMKMIKTSYCSLNRVLGRYKLLIIISRCRSVH
jgi:hypothetical protein